MFRFIKYSSLFVMVITPLAGAASLPSTQVVQNNYNPQLQNKFAQLESSFGGRLGIAAINTSNQQTILYRAAERFPLCSTGKVMAVAAVLKKSEQESNLLSKNITYSQEDLAKSGYAPITKQHLAKGMNVGALCQAAIDYSDNLAMNLLISEVGGASKVTDYARSIGDTSYRLDRLEPELNSAIPNDVRDTTTPLAMSDSLQKLVLANTLASAPRHKLQSWLKDNTTGNARIRAAVPNGWVVGDKTGTGDYGTTNDVGVIWPAKCQPLVISVYFTQFESASVPKDAVIAAATRLVINEFAKSDKCLHHK